MKSHIIFLSWFTIVVLLFLCLIPGSNAVTTAGFVGNLSPVIVVDAGHGGDDGGAVAHDGTTESSINLTISRRIENLLAFCGFPSVMTRSEEHINYPDSCSTIRSRKRWDQEQRVTLINHYNDAVLISIHQNYYPSSGPNGAQVLYGGIAGSETLAAQMQQSLINNLQPDNRRCAAAIGDSIYLMRKVNCPAILVECGFLSNPLELQALKDNAYQTKLALIISVSVSSYCCGVIYEN